MSRCAQKRNFTKYMLGQGYTIIYRIMRDVLKKELIRANINIKKISYEQSVFVVSYSVSVYISQCVVENPKSLICLGRHFTILVECEIREILLRSMGGSTTHDL